MLTEIHLFYMAHILQAIHDWLIRGQGGWTTRWQTRVSEKRLAWWRSGIRQWTRDLWWARNTGCRRTWWNLFHWADVIHVNSCSTFLEMYICIHLERWINKLTVILQNCLSPNVEHDGHLGRRKILRCAEYYQTLYFLNSRNECCRRSLTTDIEIHDACQQLIENLFLKWLTTNTEKMAHYRHFWISRFHTSTTVGPHK